MVHRAVQPGVDRDVAIKIIRAELADRPDFIRRFEFEARTVARLEHPQRRAAVRLLARTRRRVPGDAAPARAAASSRRCGRAGPYSREQTVRLLDEVGGRWRPPTGPGWSTADVRPANLLLDTEGTTYLADFGIALPTAASDDCRSESRPTRRPRCCGVNRPVAAADVFSLAVTTFEVLTGRLPFADSNEPGRAHPPSAVRATAAGARHAHRPARRRSTTSSPGRPPRRPATDTHRRGRSSTTSCAGARPRPSRERPPRRGADRLATDRSRTRTSDCTRSTRGMPTASSAERPRGRTGRCLERRPMVTVVGPSGSGKSSVVRAGRAPGDPPGRVSRLGELVRRDDGARGPTPSTRSRRPCCGSRSTRQRRCANSSPSTAVCACDPRVLPDEHTRILLVIDQFEELFTQVRRPRRARSVPRRNSPMPITHPESTAAGGRHTACRPLRRPAAACERWPSSSPAAP